MGWTVQGSNPGGGNYFTSRLDRPWSPPSFLYKGNRISFTGVKQPGRGLTTHPRLTSWLMKEWSYTSTPSLDFHVTIQGNFYLSLSYLPRERYQPYLIPLVWLSESYPGSLRSTRWGRRISNIQHKDTVCSLLDEAEEIAEHRAWITT